MRERVVAWTVLVAVLLLAAVVPVVLERDSFPLSTYPMFSAPRTATEAVDTVVLVGADASVRRLSPTQIAGTDEVVTAGVAVTTAIRAGRAAAFCEQVATRLDNQTDDQIDDQTDDQTDGARGTVEVVTERYDAIAWFRGDRTPIERRVHARCDAR